MHNRNERQERNRELNNKNKNVTWKKSNWYQTKNKKWSRNRPYIELFDKSQRSFLFQNIKNVINTIELRLAAKKTQIFINWKCSLGHYSFPSLSHQPNVLVKTISKKKKKEMKERNPCEKTYRINMMQKNLHMYSKLGSKLVRLLWSLMGFWNRLNQQQNVKKKEFNFFFFF